MSTLKKAIEIATEAHKDQLDKNNDTYLLHILRVMNAGRTEKEKIAGVLHDLIEDTDWTFNDLESEGFSKEIIDAVKCLTKKGGEDYSQFIERIKTNALAVKVKLNDLIDNMDIKRLSEVKEKDISRLNKYLQAYNDLINIE